MSAFDITRFPVHLGLGATVVQEPAFNGMEWYSGYGQRHAADGFEGRLVSVHSYDAPWKGWEMHPNGAELVVCTSGKMTLLQEIDGQLQSVTLTPGQAAINPPGVWHTADVHEPSTGFFITSGLGTQHRPR
jgi:mannose-6-phosphate isomerase-like protein (cupin superfamily)